MPRSVGTFEHGAGAANLANYTLPEADERLTPILTIASGLQSLLSMQGVFLGRAEEAPVAGASASGGLTAEGDH